MKGYIGTKTKFFPWLVELELVNSSIPKNEHRRIVQAVARRIATSKEKEQKQTAADAKTDPRPKTRQLIHLGPGHAAFFVQRLTNLRDRFKEQYDYFLDPVTGFQENVSELLADKGLSEKDREKIVKASWFIAKSRMAELLESAEDDEPEPVPELEGDQPTSEHARLIAEKLPEFQTSNPDKFKTLTQIKDQKKETAPKKRKKMDEFLEAFRSTTHYHAVDIALFGRMTTSDAFQDVEAAMQVAHAISTHAAINEVDYFTAVDDLGKAGGGAGHVDEAIYNSACFYKYFNLDWDQLVHNLSGPEPDKEKDGGKHREWREEIKPQAERLAASTLGHFIQAAALTAPNGKQNSFASHCDPCGILVEIKKNAKIPTSYANAFAEPVERIGKPDDDAPDEKSLEGRSVACLADHVKSLRNAYQIESDLLWYSPKLWRFPLQYWERAEDGKKKKSDPVTTAQFSTLEGLVEAVTEQLDIGLTWAEVKESVRTTGDLT